MDLETHFTRIEEGKLCISEVIICIARFLQIMNNDVTI